MGKEQRQREEAGKGANELMKEELSRWMNRNAHASSMSLAASVPGNGLQTRVPVLSCHAPQVCGVALLGLSRH